MGVTDPLTALPILELSGVTQPARYCPKRSRVMTLLKWALIMFIVSVVAAVFGFTDLAAASVDVARVLFYIFLLIFLILLVLGLLGALGQRGVVKSRAPARSRAS